MISVFIHSYVVISAMLRERIMCFDFLLHSSSLICLRCVPFSAALSQSCYSSLHHGGSARCIMGAHQQCD